MSEEDQNLPAPILPDSVVIDAPTHLHENATEMDAIRSELPMFNGVLEACHMSLTQVRSISHLDKVVNMIIKVTKARRDVLGLPYGNKALSSGGKPIGTIPD